MQTEGLVLLLNNRSSSGVFPHSYHQLLFCQMTLDRVEVSNTHDVANLNLIVPICDYSI